MSKRKGRAGERGVVIVLAGVGLIVTLLFVGLFADLGMAFVTKARLAKAVDAGALAACRNAGRGESAMRDIANQVASANYALPGSTFGIAIDTPSTDTTRVTLTATTQISTLFMRVLGPQTISMRALGEATRFPLDLSLVLDVSQSLERNGAFDDLQAAAKSFVGRFSDQVDQVGLVTFSTVATEIMPLQKTFQAKASTAIDGLAAIADTNIDEGLRFGTSQLGVAPTRPMAIKVLVLFTDGRPTAFRDVFTVKKPPGTYDGVIGAYISGASVRGLFEPVLGQKVLSFTAAGLPVLAPNLSPATSADLPATLPGGLAVTGDDIRAVGVSQAEASANAARAAGYRVYCVGLGTLTPVDPGDLPDLDLLRRLANEDGIVDPAQPRGVSLYAPTPADLSAAFSQLADRILTRLTR